MLAKDSDGPTDFEDGNEDGWPVGRKEPSKISMNKKRHHT